jgi:hypothetical protein
MIHVLIGMVIGLKFNILLIVILGLISHFLLDIIPHWDGSYNKKEFEKTGKYEFNRKTTIIRSTDAIIALILIGVFFNITNSYLLLFGAFISLLPDLVKGGYIIGLNKNKSFMKYLRWHSKIQGETSALKGLLIQAVALIILLTLIFLII